MTAAFVIAPIAILLAIGFIVVVLAQKTQGVVKLFGILIAVLLWASAILAAYAAASGNCPMMKMMKKHGKYRSYKKYDMKKQCEMMKKQCEMIKK